MKRNVGFFLVSLFCLLITACDDTTTYAPVVDVSHFEPLPKTGMHRVVRGETLYEIAWRYGLDYRFLAKNNHIPAPYRLSAGRLISLRHPLPAPKPLPPTSLPPEAPKLVNKPIKTLYKPVLEKAKRHLKSPVLPEPNNRVSVWAWPARGKVIKFTNLNKGINILGHPGDAIYAAAPGKVVYCGNGLRGYGNLLIIKHNSDYLSAYAHNRIILVREGDTIKQGQKIAEMGSTGTDKVMLHFEIRRAGKPIDPLSLLKAY